VHEDLIGIEQLATYEVASFGYGVKNHLRQEGRSARNLSIISGDFLRDGLFGALGKEVATC
jgi:hypothetical protein